MWIFITLIVANIALQLTSREKLFLIPLSRSFSLVPPSPLTRSPDKGGDIFRPQRPTEVRCRVAEYLEPFWLLLRVNCLSACCSR